MASYKTLNDIQDITGKHVLVRLDFNVPIKDNNVVDAFRIIQALSTINFLKEKGAKIVIISHIEGESDTLKPVFTYLQNIYHDTISFCEDCIENGVTKLNEMHNGQIMLCENVRLYDGEKKNDSEFAKKIARLGEIYVNDAFSVSHRKHASVVEVTQYIKETYMGLQFEKEVAHLSKMFNPPHPFLFILGGAKFDTKLPLVEKFLPIADTIFITGALANDFYKAEGLEIGLSKISDTNLDLTALLKNPKILIQPDVTVQSSRAILQKKPQHIEKDERVLDAGDESVTLLGQKIKDAQCILWNGPLGNYENGFTKPTEDVAEMIAHSNAMSVVGGGDTLAAIAKLGLQDKFSFISTGGGAMLDFLAQGTLPGIEALKRK